MAFDVFAQVFALKGSFLIKFVVFSDLKFASGARERTMVNFGRKPEVDN